MPLWGEKVEASFSLFYLDQVIKFRSCRLKDACKSRLLSTAIEDKFVLNDQDAGWVIIAVYSIGYP
jgi:hypothetical protein